MKSYPLTARRISIVGMTGSGKTVLARQLSECLGLPHVELDALHWKADGAPCSHEVFYQRALEVLADEEWIVDGHYRSIRDVIWARADTVIWLDYPLPVVLGRLLLRHARNHGLRHPERAKEGAPGIRRRIPGSAAQRWTVRARRWVRSLHERKDYPILFRRQEYAPLQVVHLHLPHDAEELVLHLSQKHGRK